MGIKQKRLLFRTILLGFMLILVGYTIYQISFKDQGSINGLKGEKAANFTAKTINNEAIELHKLTGEKTLINFWGSWCEPCKREMPLLQETYSKYKNDGFNLIAVNVGDTDFVINRFVKDYQLTFPVVIDEKSSIKQSYNIGNLPATFLINSEGVIEEVHEGEITKETLNQWLNY